MMLNFLRWLRGNAQLDFSVLLIRGGELLAEFAEVAPVAVAHGSQGARGATRTLERVAWGNGILGPLPKDMTRLERAARMGARKVVTRSLQEHVYRPGTPDLVYLNTVASGSALAAVRDGTRVLTHVHEMGFELRRQRHYEPSVVRQVIARTSRYIAASGAVADALTLVHGIDPKSIDVCHGFVTIDDTRVEPQRVEAAREKLGIDPRTLLVGSVGTIEWRKGADLFIQVAKRVLEIQAARAVAFVWVGGPIDFDWEAGVRHDLDSLGLAERVHFIGAVPDPSPIVEAMDVFVMASRSDAFPLACLEAAAHGKPVVCFNAGGMTEFLRADERLLVPYLDVSAMAARIGELLASREEREHLGQQLAARVRERHRLESSAPLLLERIRQALAVT